MKKGLALFAVCILASILGAWTLDAIERLQDQAGVHDAKQALNIETTLKKCSPDVLGCRVVKARVRGDLHGCVGNVWEVFLDIRAQNREAKASDIPECTQEYNPPHYYEYELTTQCGDRMVRLTLMRGGKAIASKDMFIPGVNCL